MTHELVGRDFVCKLQWLLGTRQLLIANAE